MLHTNYILFIRQWLMFINPLYTGNCYKNEHVVVHVTSTITLDTLNDCLKKL